MGNLAEALTGMTEAAEADFSYPEHAPEWLRTGSIQMCTVCGTIAPRDETGIVLPTGVIYRGGPALDEEAEELYRLEKQS